MTTKFYDETIPVFFFSPRDRKVLEGRFVPRQNLEGGLSAVQGFDGACYLSNAYTFRETRKEAKKDGVKFFKAEIAVKRAELEALWKELFQLKWGIGQ